jgi:hypothetical protein
MVIGSEEGKMMERQLRKSLGYFVKCFGGTPMKAVSNVVPETVGREK